MKEILVTGSSGLVGSRFVELSKYRDQLILPDEKELDITDAELTRKFLAEVKPEVVINLAAYTNVTEAENQRGDRGGLCYRLNVLGVANLLSAIGGDTYFVQISTDMVFPGSAENPGPYAEDGVPESNSDKLTWYGFTKQEGERLVRERLGDRGAILRLIYPVRAKYGLKPDYLRKPLKLFNEGKLYPLFTDQQMSISFVDEICLVLDALIEKKARGIFHAGSADLGMPFEIVSYLLEKTAGAKNAVKPASLSDFLKTVDSPSIWESTPHSTSSFGVRYPMFGGLKVEETVERLGVKFSTWREIIDQLVAQGIEV